MNVARLCLHAMTVDGRFRKAWAMAVATYFYTRSHDGDQLSDDPNDVIRFSRWYCFRCAIEIAREYLWKAAK